MLSGLFQLNYIENYRPVANLCSVSKVFEKLILTRIYELEIINGINLAGKQQQGFQKNKSTLTAGLLLQSLIAGASDDDKIGLNCLSNRLSLLNKTILLNWLNESLCT